MPDDRLERARRTLPAGYRFGDASGIVGPDWITLHTAYQRAFPLPYASIGVRLPQVWRPAPADQPIRLSDAISTQHWNTIEGETP
jgi:hypothetical protein